MRYCRGGGAGENGLDELFYFAAGHGDLEEVGVCGGGFFVDYSDVAEEDFADSAEVGAFQH